MMANCIGLVLDSLVLDGTLPAANATIIKNNLQALAARIARNREIAGFHYNSDTTGGVKLADDMFAQLKADLTVVAPAKPRMQKMYDAFTKAKLEWTPQP
jgi:hypothetical protein